MRFCQLQFLLCVFLSTTAIKVFAQDFGYEGVAGPNFWGEKYHHCVGKHQSPINIEEHNVQFTELLPITYENFHQIPEEVTLKNNGHTVIVTMKMANKPSITGGPLLGRYEFEQLHFHWGSDDTEGSENTINNSSYPMELHIVFFQKAYGSFKDALEHPDGLTVLSFLFSNSQETNEHYTSTINSLADLESSNAVVHIPNKLPSIEDLIVTNRSVYFTYGGSLTTPPCSEVVTWIEFKNTIPLTHEQIEVFRLLKDEHGKNMSHNFRPTQPLYGRLIRMVNDDLYHSYDKKYNNNNNSANIQGMSYVLLLTVVALHVSKLNVINQ